MTDQATPTDPNATPAPGGTPAPVSPVPVPAPGTNNAPTVQAPPGAVLSVSDAVVSGKPVSTLAPADQGDLFTKADQFYKDAIYWLGGIKEDVREKVQMVVERAGHRWREALNFVKTHAAGIEKGVEGAAELVKTWAVDDAKAVADVASTAPEMDALAAQIQEMEKQYGLEYVNRSHNFQAPMPQQKVMEAKMKDVVPTFSGIGGTWTEAVQDLEKKLAAYEANFKAK